MNNKKSLYCYDCNKVINASEYKYSNYHFGRSLCRKHQKEILPKISPEAKKLYKELRKQKIRCT